MVHEATSDIPDDFEDKFLTLCEKYDWEPISVLKCWNSESELKSHEQNPNGFASGIFQLMPDTAHGLGWMPGDPRWNAVAAARKAKDWKGSALLLKQLMAGYIQLNATEQLDWAEKFYGPKGPMRTGAECYVRTFLPAEKDHADDPYYILCGINGPYKDAYIANHQVFDKEGKGYIRVQDLTDRIELVWQGARAEEIATRIYDAQGIPEDQRPVYQYCNTETLAGCQEGLNKLGFDTLSVLANGKGDGIWGPHSCKACEEFQTRDKDLFDLQVTGHPDRPTREALAVALIEFVD